MGDPAGTLPTGDRITGAAEALATDRIASTATAFRIDFILRFYRVEVSNEWAKGLIEASYFGPDKLVSNGLFEPDCCLTHSTYDLAKKFPLKIYPGINFLGGDF